MVNSIADSAWVLAVWDKILFCVAPAQVLGFLAVVIAGVVDSISGTLLTEISFRALGAEHLEDLAWELAVVNFIDSSSKLPVPESEACSTIAFVSDC